MIHTVKQQFFWCFCVLAAGALCTLGFAPFRVFPFGILAPAILLLSWRFASKKQASVLGFCFGLGLFGSGVHWIFNSMYLYTSMPIALSLFFTVLFISYLSLFPALAGYISKKIFPDFRLKALLFGIPAVWTLVEWIRSWFLSGFPWLFLGYTQTQTPLAAFATYFSVYGVSLICMMCAGCLNAAIQSYQEKKFARLYLIILLFASFWLVGEFFSLKTWTHPLPKNWRVALVQANIPQNEKWTQDLLSLSLDRYQKMSQPLFGKVDLIIWPETAAPAGLKILAPWIEELDQAAKKNGTELILGIPIETENENSFYNGIITLGEQHSFYFKRRLVPFGEFTPFRSILSPLMEKLNIPLSDLTPTFENRPLKFKQHLIAAAICYEIAFPELILTRNAKINAILTVSNDAWFGEHSLAQSQHLEIAQMRAIELQRPVLVVSNSGQTANINFNGQVTAELPTDIEDVLISSITPREGLTPWQILGMDGILLILIVFLYIAYRDQYLSLNQQPWKITPLFFSFFTKIKFKKIHRENKS